MGNETSLPTDSGSGVGSVNDGSDLDDQGRVPHQQKDTQQHLSSTPTTHSNPSHERRPLDRGQRTGVRMIGAVFGKGPRGGASGHHPPQVSSLQDSEDRDATKASNKSLNDNSADHGSRSETHETSSSGYYEPAPPHPYVHNNGGDVIVTSHDYFAQAQQQNYYSAHQLNHQQVQQHQIPYYGGRTHQANQHTHPVVHDKSANSVSLDVNQKEHPVVSVMYERPPVSPAQKK